MQKYKREKSKVKRTRMKGEKGRKAERKKYLYLYVNDLIKKRYIKTIYGKSEYRV